ncbi:MAG: hypothetical protein OHK0046_51440 [Anaerolineae bacterium]
MYIAFFEFAFAPVGDVHACVSCVDHVRSFEEIVTWMGAGRHTPVCGDRVVGAV